MLGGPHSSGVSPGETFPSIQELHSLHGLAPSFPPSSKPAVASCFSGHFTFFFSDKPLAHKDTCDCIQGPCISALVRAHSIVFFLQPDETTDLDLGFGVKQTTQEFSIRLRWIKSISLWGLGTKF